MRRSRYVMLLATGGTIATVAVSDGRTAPAVPAARLAAVATGVGVEIRSEQLSQTPSWALGPQDMWGIALRARDVARDPDCAGVVVTHGTSTLEYTAYFADLALDTDTPVVFTGAMRRADDAAPDGPANVLSSVRVAASPEARARGALVCFAGEILAARDVWKAERASDHAFVGLGGRVGLVRDGRVEFAHAPARRRSFSGSIDASVALVKAYPGGGGSGIDAALRSGARGVVIEGMPGSGGIPPPMREALARACDTCRAVVLASRAPYGSLPDTGGGTGSPLAGLRLASAGQLTSEKSWVLLTVVLGHVSDDATAIQTFEEVAKG